MKGKLKNKNMTYADVLNYIKEILDKNKIDMILMNINKYIK
ncbi:hypothetical protein [Methanothermococcus sp.]|nr:hypothetical protein [Methanothermococcus sp.]